MEQEFEGLIEHLTSEEAEIPHDRLSDLSDLNADLVKRFLSAWPEMTAARRRGLIEDLGQLADEQIELRFEAINLAVLDDDDAGVRLQAIRNLWECDKQALSSSLLRMLVEDDSAEVREASAQALGRFIHLHELDELRGINGTELEQALIDLSKRDPSPKVRQESLIALGYSSHPAVPDLILKAYRTGKEAHQLASLKAISRSADDLWREQVIEQLHSPFPELRAEAVRAAGELTLRETLDDIIGHLDDVSDLVREAAIWTLGQLGGKSALESLGQLVDEAADEGERKLLSDAIDNLVFIEGMEQAPIIDIDLAEDSAT